MDFVKTFFKGVYAFFDVFLFEIGFSFVHLGERILALGR